MEPNRLGRILGIGVRVAADKLRERTAQASPPAQRPAAPQPAPPAPGPKSPSTRPSTGAKISSAEPFRSSPPKITSPSDGPRRLARGAGRFTLTLFRPFAHATGILILQVTGLFFAFFAVGFSVYSFKLYKVAGWRDHHLPLYAAFAILFAWFAVSSFWRASRRQKQT
jgi:hypothetical protein